MIDTHQHLLYPDRFRYDWVAGVPDLQGPFGLNEYRTAAAGGDIEGTVFMEVDVAPDDQAGEAAFFCRLADDPSSGILGVVAAGRPEEPGFEKHLDAIAHPKLAGIRRILHTQPDGLSQDALFRENVRRLGDRGLTFDLCFQQRQLGLALDLVRACPQTVFVLDHCGVPEIAANDAPHGSGFRDWKCALTALASEPNVHLKISGLSVYAQANQRTEAGLWPYIETAIDVFSPARCLWGGDWPVVNLGSGLAKWVELSRLLIPAAAGDQAHLVFSGNARRVYQLAKN